MQHAGRALCKQQEHNDGQQTDLLIGIVAASSRPKHVHGAISSDLGNVETFLQH